MNIRPGLKHIQYKENKTGTASLVQPRASHNIMNGKRSTLFNTVDTFVLRTVVSV